VDVKYLIDSLLARMETNKNLLVNLFKAYKAISDHEFIYYICKKEDKYKEERKSIPKLSYS